MESKWQLKWEGKKTTRLSPKSAGIGGFTEREAELMIFAPPCPQLSLQTA